jgi:hypothetical protein
MRDWILEHTTEAIFYEPAELDAALIGIALRYGMSVPAYDYHKLMSVHMERGMSQEEAIEWIESQTIGQWIGEDTPIIVYQPGEG